MNESATPSDKSKHGKRHHPTPESRKLVSDLSALGIRREDIAILLDVSHVTALKHYRKEMREGSIKANIQIAKTLYQKAIEGDVTCLIFWAKTRMGWKTSDDTDLRITIIGGLPALPIEKKSLIVDAE